VKLIKSSIYLVNGNIARFIGRYNEAGLPIFSAHGTEMIAELANVGKATAEQVNAYLGR